MKYYKLTIEVPAKDADKKYQEMLEKDNAPHDSFEARCILESAIIDIAANGDVPIGVGSFEEVERKS